MRRWLFAFAIVVTSFTFSSQYSGSLSDQSKHTHTELCEGFLPENDMYIPTTWDLRAGGISEQEFNSILDRIQALYDPEVNARGATLSIARNWESGTVNASAMRNGRNWLISMYGGLARHPAVTADGFALVACHEMGHHLGGAPKIGPIFGPARKWASNEGAADYYSTLKCMRRLFEHDDNEKILSQMELDPAVVQTCQEQHPSRSEQLLCIRGAMAGLSVSGMFSDLSKSRGVSFTTPDPAQVRKTNHRHPAAQCRLDTYYAGALCAVGVEEAMNDRDYRPGSCADQNVHKLGLRPRCWFKPSKTGSRRGGIWDVLPESLM
ncbi:MAG: hypothetical protein NDI61_11380 [Bdellovibrionaceae bacterium]|nr:hypothetical protein [Pseudobdellovibrionaceae bacterium]